MGKHRNPVGHPGKRFGVVTRRFSLPSDPAPIPAESVVADPVLAVRGRGGAVRLFPPLLPVRLQPPGILNPMPLGERERRWLEAVKEWNRENELASGWGTPEDRRWMRDRANEWRARHGIPPLEDHDDDYPPELEFYERARARGML